MWTHFEAIADAQETIFGPVRVAYHSFSFTGLDGHVTERGIPH